MSDDINVDANQLSHNKSSTHEIHEVIIGLGKVIIDNIYKAPGQTPWALQILPHSATYAGASVTTMNFGNVDI